MALAGKPIIISNKLVFSKKYTALSKETVAFTEMAISGNVKNGLLCNLVIPNIYN